MWTSGGCSSRCQMRRNCTAERFPPHRPGGPGGRSGPPGGGRRWRSAKGSGWPAGTVESARVVIERHGLRRRIADVDDSDTFVCRPHAPGEIRHALLGGELLTAMRRGKTMWCLSSEAVTLGIHLGMSGKIVIADADGTEIDGGDYWEGGRKPGDYRWARFTLTFDDGGRLMLVDPRRLGRVRLNPPVEQLGPDAQLITPAQFRAALAGSTAPVKARLMDQRKIAGIGNLLADEILWRARIHPARLASSLTSP